MSVPIQRPLQPEQVVRELAREPTKGATEIRSKWIQEAHGGHFKHGQTLPPIVESPVIVRHNNWAEKRRMVRKLERLEEYQQSTEQVKEVFEKIQRQLEQKDAQILAQHSRSPSQENTRHEERFPIDPGAQQPFRDMPAAAPSSSHSHFSSADSQPSGAHRSSSPDINGGGSETSGHSRPPSPPSKNDSDYDPEEKLIQEVISIRERDKRAFEEIATKGHKFVMHVIDRPPEERILKLNLETKSLTWDAEQQAIRILDITSIQHGKVTKALQQKYTKDVPREVFLTILTRSQSINLQCKDQAERDYWSLHLREMY